MPKPLKRWDQPVAVTVELVFTGAGEVMSAVELAHMMFHELRGQQWKLYPEGDGGQPSVVELKVARPLCQGEGCEWHGGGAEQRMARDIRDFHGGPAPVDEVTAALHGEGCEWHGG